VARVITQEVNPEAPKKSKLSTGQAKIIFGAVQDEKLKKGEIKVNLIATGF
jgi:cell division GTPase FtsZ